MRRLNTLRSALVILSAVWAALDGAWAARPDEDRWSEGASVAELNRMFDEIRDTDLQVRVCGWNVRWNDLSKLEQDMFIKTAEGQE